MNPLTEMNVMEYFSLSPFYEKSSINQACAVQKIDFTTQKTKYVGIEFNLESAKKDNSLFVISKNYRNYNETIPISYYYVFKATIYQSPDIYSILTRNVESISNNLLNVINEINQK